MAVPHNSRSPHWNQSAWREKRNAGEECAARHQIVSTSNQQTVPFLLKTHRRTAERKRDLGTSRKQQCLWGVMQSIFSSVSIKHAPTSVRQNQLKAFQHAACRFRETLPSAHDMQVVICSHTENLKYLVEHLSMLGRYAHFRRKSFCMGKKIFNDRAHILMASGLVPNTNITLGRRLN